MGKLAVVFPGQGAQLVGMGQDVAAAFSAARDTFAEADRILGFELSSVCFEGPAERLDATDISQPAIFATSVALWRAAEQCGVAADWHPQATAGLSLGEYTALWLAGSLTFEDGLRLVRRRGELMQSASERSRGGMVSVMGLQPAQVEVICREAAGPDVLSMANFNCPGQIVISGSITACERSLAAVEAAGGRGIPLRVAGAFHSALMQTAADGLGPVLASTAIETPRIPVVSNVTSDYHRGPESVRDGLRRQVVEAVRWQESVERLIRDGFTDFVEVGPGKVLTGLLRKIDRSVTGRNYSSAASLSATPVGGRAS